MRTLRGVAAVASGIFVLAISQGAQAQSLWTDPPKATSWHGFYVGAHAGGVVDDDLDGGLYGAHVGFNHQRGRLVFGLEGDISGSSIDGSAPCNGLTCKTEIDWLYSVRGRLGLAFDHVLAYGTAGWAGAEVDLTTTGLGQSISADDHVDGFVYGGGVEVKLSSCLSVGVEALHYDFDDAVSPQIATVLSKSVVVNDPKSDPDFTAVRARLTFHFGAEPAAVAPLK